MIDLSSFSKIASEEPVKSSVSWSSGGVPMILAVSNFTLKSQSNSEQVPGVELACEPQQVDLSKAAR